MSNEQVRKVIPYKPGKRPNTLRRLNIEFAGTALEQALAERDAPLAVEPDIYAASESLSLSSSLPVSNSDSQSPSESDSESVSLSYSPTHSDSEPLSLSQSVSAPEPLSHSQSLPLEPTSPDQSLSPSRSLSQSASLSHTDSPSHSLSARETSLGTTVLDATHTGAEQRVYSQLYRETLSKSKVDGYFSIPDLQRLTGIRSPNTIRKAISGLSEKLSIQIIAHNQGSHFGARYRVFGPKEIIASRKKAGLIIDLRTKRIISDSRSLSPSASQSKVASESLSSSESQTENDSIDRQKLTVREPHVYINNNTNPDGSLSSSVPSHQNDDNKLAKVRKLFEQLSNGGSWKDERDLKAYKDIADINLFHITLGLCYSVSKSPEHKMSSLAYAVPSIQQHAADMDEFSPTTLEEIAYRTKRKTMNCIAEGKWSIPDWETGKE